MRLAPKITFILEVDADELRLINAALRCSLSEEQHELAGKLSNELCSQRVQQTKHMLGELDKLDKNLKTQIPQ